MTDIRRPWTYARGPWTRFVIAPDRNGYRLMFGLSTRDQDAAREKKSAMNILSGKV
jgi:hypothetical protein